MTPPRHPRPRSSLALDHHEASFAFRCRLSLDSQSDTRIHYKPMTPALTPRPVSAAWLAAMALAAHLTVTAQTTLSRGHMDLGVAYGAGALEAHIHVHDPEPDGAEYGPGEAVILAGPTARTTVPANPAFSFLGLPGQTSYILSSSLNPELPFLGLAAEEVESGVFVGDSLRLALTGYSGPGEFALYTMDAFGRPGAHVNTRDGVTGDDHINLIAGSHNHANWAFSAPGDYSLTFIASGTLVGGGAIASEPATFAFTVVPEPRVWGLLAIGGAALLWRTRKRGTVVARTRATLAGNELRPTTVLTQPHRRCGRSATSLNP